MDAEGTTQRSEILEGIEQQTHGNTEVQESEIISETNRERILQKLIEPPSEEAQLTSIIMGIFFRCGGKLSIPTIWQKVVEGFRKPKEGALSREGTENGMMDRLGIVTYPEVKEMAAKSIPFLVEDLIPTKSIGILVGEWGIGKSPLAVQLQLSLASGNSFLGRFAAGSAIPVLYVDLENEICSVSEIGEVIAGFLGLSTLPSNAFLYGGNYSPVQGLGNPEKLEQLIHASGAKLVIIDPLRAFSPNAPEKNENAINLINSLRKITQNENCSALLIHHPKKPKDSDDFSLEEDPTAWFQQASGVASLVQNVDFRIGLEKNGSDELVMRHFIRAKGWYDPIFIVREKDQETTDPIGYRPKSPLDDLEANDREKYNSLPQIFTTADAKRIFNLSDNPTNERLKGWIDVKLVQKNRRGEYKKLWTESAGGVN
jgi:hypothetical protein